MQPREQGKQASLPSQEQCFGSTQPNTVKKVWRRCAFAVFHLHLGKLQEADSTSNHCRSGGVMEETSWRQLSRNIRRPGLPDAERLTF